MDPLSQQIVDYHAGEIFPRVLDLFLAPVEHPQMFWIITPVVMTLLLTQLYFGRYRGEELGWNTAFSNTIALFFVTATLLRELFRYNDPVDFVTSGSPLTKLVILLFMGVLAMIQAVCVYFHVMPKALAFFLSSGLNVNVVAFVMTVLIFSDIRLDWTTFYAAIILLFITYCFFALVRLLVEPSAGSKAAITKSRTRRRRQRAAVLAHLKKQWESCTGVSKRCFFTLVRMVRNFF